MTAAPSEPVRSFRDPAGSVALCEGRILRTVAPAFRETFEQFVASPLAVRWVEQGRLVATYPTDDPFTYEHERVAFPSYPYEWPAEMLYSAAQLTMDLANGALNSGFGLKDATPYNVLFRGSRPVFVDLLSFERRNPADSSWMPYGQFTRTFVLPLLAAKKFGMRLPQIFSGSRDGLDPETVYRWTGPLQKVASPYLGLVTLPKLLSGRASKEEDYRVKPARSEDQARFILDGILRRARKQLESVAPAGQADSTWTGYLDHKSLYSRAQLAQKERFVQQCLELAKPRTMLDVGANEGHFSLMGARAGASVVAIDTDDAVVGAIWKRAHQEGADVLPLVVDITRPSPAMGWMNRENLSFLARSERQFDLVSMLAVIHHILISERIPLESLLELADQLSREYLLVEFVGPQDAMFRRILRGRADLYTHVTRQWFEQKAQERFELIRSEKVDGLDRWLYLLRQRSVKN